MNATQSRSLLGRLFADYGMVLVLLVLCAYFSWATLKRQQVNGVAGAEQLAGRITRQYDAGARCLIVARSIKEDLDFAETLQAELEQADLTVVEVVNGQPADVRQALLRAADQGQPLDLVACNEHTQRWVEPQLERLGRQSPALADAAVMLPRGKWWPDFLKRDNLRNIANQIAVIAIIAIGMTMVIITAGIDLSVGSLIALSAVVSTWLIVRTAGAEQATPVQMTLCCCAAIGVCGLVGAFSGVTVTAFRIPPFITTLAMMQVASGYAYILAKGESIYQVPESFVWLGRGEDIPGVPNAVFLMLVLYVVAHLVMSRTTLGRHIYAVGGNAEAARLSGVPIRRVTIFVYLVCGTLAGLGGVVLASQLKSGSPTYGLMYELLVIAAVVVGGTSLAGGEGKIFGTLIGAFIIAVIQNGMNLTGVESYRQKVVLGFVILGAVLLDTFKRRGWRLFKLGSGRKPT